jgi:hypothetical protein
MVLLVLEFLECVVQLPDPADQFGGQYLRAQTAPRRAWTLATDTGGERRRAPVGP